MVLAVELLSCVGLWNLAASSSYCSFCHFRFLTFPALLLSLPYHRITPASIFPILLPLHLVHFLKCQHFWFPLRGQKVRISVGELKNVTEVFRGSPQSVEPNVKVLSTNLIHARFFPHLLKWLFPNRPIILSFFLSFFLTFFLSFFYFLFCLLLPTYCRCRWLPLRLMTPIDTYTLGRTPLDEGSVRRRSVYLHNILHLRETDMLVRRRDSNLLSKKAGNRRPTP